MFQDAIEDMVKKSKSVIPINEDDYIKDGLLYCAKCNTPKQTVVNVLGKQMKPFCLCKCEQEKIEADRQRIRQEEFMRRIEHQRKVGFPESDMHSWTFANDDLHNEKLTKVMQNYVDNFSELKKQGKGLLLYGTVGTGKTYSACEVANALIDKGIPCLVTNFSRLTNTIQGMYDGKQEYIDSLNNFDLIVIDDLGAERKSEYMQEMVFNIVDNRYRSGLPMIVTTNLTIEELKNPSGITSWRIYDRILEKCFPIEVSGGSRRRESIRQSYEQTKELLGL